MTLRAESRLERVLHQGMFSVTGEVVPPRSGDPTAARDQARGMVGYVDAANVTDNPTSSAHMSAVAGASFVAQAGLEPVVQMTCRDRNRLALTADLLGAWAVGARNVLCLTGDPVSAGDHPEAREVNDLSVIELVSLATRLRDGGTLLSGAPVADPPRFFVGVADVPLSSQYDFGRLEAKIDAGADFVQTQIVFDAEGFRRWADEARSRGILDRVFVLAGVAVLGSGRSARFVREHLPGAAVPDRVVDLLDRAGPDAEAEGVRLTVEVVARLKAVPGIAGIHVMGLGRMEPVRRVIEAAGLFPRPAMP